MVMQSNRKDGAIFCKLPPKGLFKLRSTSNYQ